jgi:hypothetical protein
VSRYEIDSSAATLWVNPTSESDDGYRATDLQNPSAITAYGFRQDAGLGCTILVDDLVIGLSFAAVTVGALGPVNPLTIQASGGTVILTWSVPGWHLQSASALAGPFADLSASSSPYSNRISGHTRFFRLYPD